MGSFCYFFEFSRDIIIRKAEFYADPTPRSAGVGHLPSVFVGKRKLIRKSRPLKGIGHRLKNRKGRYPKWVRFATFFPHSPIRSGTSFSHISVEHAGMYTVRAKIDSAKMGLFGKRIISKNGHNFAS